VRRDALAMAKGGPLAPSVSQPSAGKGDVPPPTAARAGSAAASIIAGAGAAQAAQSAGASPSLVIALAAGGVALAAASWLGWNLWRGRKQQMPASIASEAAP
jgi:hypothetical protein